MLIVSGVEVELFGYNFLWRSVIGSNDELGVNELRRIEAVLFLSPSPTLNALKFCTARRFSVNVKKASWRGSKE